MGGTTLGLWTVSILLRYNLAVFAVHTGGLSSSLVPVHMQDREGLALSSPNSQIFS